jgi:cytochrome P450
MPERWLQPEDPLIQEKAGFHPFAVGGRNCIGQTLAWLEMRLIIARFVYNFDFQEVSGLAWEQQKTYMLWEKHPLLLKLSPVVDNQRIPQ